ncbi:MAG TPA: hypothetical protein VFS55_02085 [Dokdonella sp.]|nr:hypothetical protein [Dokdonella sp.]
MAFAAAAPGYVDTLGCRLHVPDGYEGNYRSDGSMSFMYPGSSINLKKLSGDLQSRVVGEQELEVKKSKWHGLDVAEGRKVNRKSGSILDFVKLSDGKTQLFILGPMVKDWKKFVVDCNDD